MEMLQTPAFGSAFKKNENVAHSLKQWRRDLDTVYREHHSMLRDAGLNDILEYTIIGSVNRVPYETSSKHVDLTNRLAKAK